MFLVRNQNIRYPKPYPKITKRVQSTASTEGEIIVDGFKLRKDVDYMPQLGMQEELCACEANLIFICGEATSGKTYGMFLKALQGVHRKGFTARLISVRLQDSKKGSSIFRDGVKVCGNFADCAYNSSDYPTFVWQQWLSNLQLIHSNFNASNTSEWEAFQDYAKKNQASLIMIDEATEIKQYKMFAYWFSRNRDSSGYPSQMILSFNPNPNHFTKEMLKGAGFLLPTEHLDISMLGTIKYFYNKGNSPEEIVWGDTKEEVVERANIVLREKDRKAGLKVTDYVKSFTVLSATSADNRELVYATHGQSIANLHAVGAEQREVLAFAYFGEVDNRKSNISNQMIYNLWSNPIDNDETMYATMDIASGTEENDNAPMVIWRGLTIIDIDYFTGKPMDISNWITQRLNKYNIPITNFAYDATGHGYWLQGLTNGIAVTANKKQIQEYDEYGNTIKTDDYYNCRSQLLGKMQVLLEKGEISCSIDKDRLIPYGRNGSYRSFVNALKDEFEVFKYMRRNNKIYYDSKEDFKKKYRYSPDLVDAISLRAIFTLDARLKKKSQKAFVDDDVYESLYQSYNYYN